MINDPILAVAVRAARRAGSIIVDAARDLKRLPSHAKGHRDIAAVANAEAKNAIAATIKTAFPGHAILGEETAESPGAKGSGGASPYKWVIDPIDGTMNFAHGFPYYAVSIALTHGAEITHAVVLDPVRDELYLAMKGKGAQMNSAPIRVSACTALQHALVGTVFPARSSPKMAAYLPVFNTMLTRCAGVRRAGACALDLAQLAAGRLDGFWVTSLNAWDVAAGALIVREAGGRVGDFAGGGDFLRTNEVIAAAPGVFSALREALTATNVSG
jgi:myo-inositol-1(or 4)-monophosphatase